MLRIVLSRAALFPWLGIALMLAGALFPEGDTAGMILVVIGANVAFYSLRDFSQKFPWGEESRAMLTLCGLLFLLGLALVVTATYFQALNRSLALFCTGLYLFLFSIWITQQPVGTGYRILAFVGLMFMFLGGMMGFLIWPEWRIFTESEETPQQMTLMELQQNGFGKNRYVRVKEFRFCDRSVPDKPGKESKIGVVWIPIVAVDGRAVKNGGPSPPVPVRVEVVASDISLGNRDEGKRVGARLPFDVLRKGKESQGYECTVVTGIKKLKPEVRQQLSEVAPLTDFDQVVVLDWGKPSSASRIYSWLTLSAIGLGLGLLALCIVYARASKIVRVAGWDSPAAEDEAQPSADQGPADRTTNENPRE